MATQEASPASPSQEAAATGEEGVPLGTAGDGDEAAAAKKAAGTAKAAARQAAAKRRRAKAPAPTRSTTTPAGARGTTKDGIAYTKDFDVKFLTASRTCCSPSSSRSRPGVRLEDEANSLIEDGEMGDVQFDDEGGEGDTMVVERERDLALSAQARQTIADIDAALERVADGTYGYSIVSGRPIPRERLEAIPWATVLVEEKVGGIGRR